MFQSHYSSRSNIIGLSLLNLKTAECQFSLPCCMRKQFVVWSLPRVPPQASQWSRSGLRGSQPPHFSFFPLCLWSIFMQREQKHFFSCSTPAQRCQRWCQHLHLTQEKTRRGGRGENMLLLILCDLKCELFSLMSGLVLDSQPLTSEALDSLKANITASVGIDWTVLLYWLNIAPYW